MAISVFAYCDQRYQHATWQVLGGATDAALMTSPPVFAADFNPEWWGGYDLIYLDLHGQPSSVYLYSGPQQAAAALGLETVRVSDLANAVVFATSCYLPQTRFVEAFLRAGARAVIAGDGENYGTRYETTGAQLLAMGLIREMRHQPDPISDAAALERAKRRLRLNPRRMMQPQAINDALEFRVFTREDFREAKSEDDL